MVDTDQVPVKVGDEITVDIHGYATQGEGVGRHQGFTIFVPDCLDGEKVLTRIELVKKNYARGSYYGCWRSHPSGCTGLRITANVAAVSSSRNILGNWSSKTPGDEDGTLGG